MGDEYGWKQVHGDVFRTPAFPLLFSSLIGTGYHVFTVAIITIILAIIGEFYTEYVGYRKDGGVNRNLKNLPDFFKDPVHII